MKLVKFTLIFLILFTSCKSSKSASKNVGVIKEMSARKVAKKHNSSYFNEKSVVASLSKGKRITVMGSCSGLMMNVHLNDCIIK